MAATIAQLRILLSDPDNGTPELSDADLTEIIAVESNLYRAAEIAARSLSAKYAQKVSVSIGDLRVSNQQKFHHYDELADKYAQRAEEGGGGRGHAVPRLAGVSLADMEMAQEDTDRYPSYFKVGGMSNPPTPDDYDGDGM